VILIIIITIKSKRKSFKEKEPQILIEINEGAFLGKILFSQSSDNSLDRDDLLVDSQWNTHNLDRGVF